MKKAKFEGKLSLNKETITKLNDDQLNQVNGGKFFTGGCSDGCGTGVFQSRFLCTNQDCSANCGDSTAHC